MSVFNDFLKEIVSGSKDLAKGALKDLAAQVKNDTQDFINQAKNDLRDWTRELAAGELSKAEFTDLVKGQADLAELHALTEAGIALTRLDRFRDALVQLVVNTAIRTFIP